MPSITFANPLPWWALSLIVGAIGALAWHAYRRFSAWPRRRLVLSALRFVTLLLLVLVLMRPVTRSHEAGGRETVVPVLVDTSRSMAIQDAGGTRIERAQALLNDELLPAVSAGFRVEVLAFGEQIADTAPDELHATARRSDLAQALDAVRERYRAQPVAGLVLISDGGDTSGLVDDVVAAGRLPAVYPIGIGSADAGVDREVLSVTAADAVLDGSRVDLDMSAVVHGSPGDPVEIRLLENGRPREVRHLRPAVDGAPLRATFQVAPAAGAATVYTVELPPVAGERVPENNRRSVLVQPPSRPRRVLLVEGAPGFEHSFLKRALTDDRGLDVDSVVRKGENDQGTDTFYIQAARARGGALVSGYPSDTPALFAYDAVIFANVGGDQLTSAQFEETRAFVARRGGGLLVLGAQSFLSRGLAGTPVEDALPMLLDRRSDTALRAGAAAANRLAVTEAGLVHPITRLGATADETRTRWADLPSLGAAAPLGRARPGAQILATTAAGGSTRPLIAVQRYGEGRAMVFTGEAAWRWRMFRPSTDRAYETFWRQAVRWIALGAADPVMIHPVGQAGAGDEVPIRIAVRDAAFQPVRDARVRIQVSGPDGRVEDLAAAPDESSAGRADTSHVAAAFTPQQNGLYRITARAGRGAADTGPASTSTAVLVGGADLEMTDPRLDVALLDRLAAATGGRRIEAGGIDALVDALRASAPATISPTTRDLWHNGVTFGLLIALLTFEWLLRRRWGLR